jgi:hypothetical protein
MHDGEPLALDQAGIHASARQRWLNVDHGKPPPLNASSRRNHCSPKITSPFSTPSVISIRLA